VSEVKTEEGVVLHGLRSSNVNDDVDDDIWPFISNHFAIEAVNKPNCSLGQLNRPIIQNTAYFKT